MANDLIRQLQKERTADFQKTVILPQDFVEDGITPFHLACGLRCGIGTKADLEKVKQPVSEIPEQINHGTAELAWTPLGIAAGNGERDIVNVLLKHGADPILESYETIPLNHAAKEGHEDVSICLFDAMESIGVSKNDLI